REIAGGKSNPPEVKKDRKSSHIIFYIALFGLLTWPSFTQAETNPTANALPATPPSGGLRLTLDQAVALALKQNTTAQIAVLTAAQSEQDRRIALSDLLPQAEFGVTDQWQRQNIRAFFGGKPLFTGLPTSAIPGHVGPYNTFSTGPS